MHHGGIGYIENSKLFLPDDLLEPLSIIPDSLLFGLYYPPPTGHPSVSLKHDFMLTSVPFRLWSKVGRLLIRLNHKPNTIQVISEYISKKNISIILTECTRSGHRYATWNLIVAFDYLDEISLVFDNEKSVYTKTVEELHKLREEILKYCKEALFTDFHDFFLKYPVVVYADTTLSYFHNKSKENVGSHDQNWQFKVFELKYNKNGFIESSHNEDFNAILDFVSEKKERNMPKCVFANMNTDEMNIRLAIIPPTDQKRFSFVNFDYIRNGTPDTSRGMITFLTKSFSENYNFWNLKTRTKISTLHRERGSTIFLVEDMSKKKKSYIDDVNKEIKRICNMKKPKHLKHITLLKGNAVPMSKVIAQISIENKLVKKNKYKYDVFISYSSIDKKEAMKIKSEIEKENLKCYMDSSELDSGSIYSDEIRQALFNSREICVLFSNNAKDSDWVKREINAAWILQKTLVPILFRANINEMPKELNRRHAIDLHNINEYVNDIIRRKEEFLNTLEAI